MSDIAIVILNWNGIGFLKQFLPSVVGFSQSAQIYVVDNASQDGSIAFLQEYFPQLRLIIHDKNYGFAQGYNKALSQIEASYYCLLNSDVEVTQGWLNGISDFFESHSDIAVLQPKILDFNKKDHFEYAGAAGGFIDRYGFPYCKGRVFDTVESDQSQYDDVSPIFWASGACLFIRSKVFKQVGGFDNLFFAHQEEIDLCWRVQRIGHRVFSYPISKVYHVGGGTLNYGSSRKVYLNFRNSLLMLLKNLPLDQVFKIIFTRMLLDGIAAARFLVSLRFGYFFAIFKAHLSFYKMLPGFIQKRKQNTSPFIASYFQCKNIVWAYFIKNKKFYKLLS